MASDVSNIPILLLAEDEPELRELIAAGLKSRFQIQVIEAESGTDAIQLLEKNPKVSIIVSDYSMPNGNGSVILDHLEKHKNKPKFIFYTSYFANQVPKKDLDRAQAFITKPCLDGSLNRYVEDFLRETLELEKQNATYVPIKKKWIFNGNKAFADYYIKLSDQHFVLFVKANTPSNTEAFLRLREKGIDDIYVSTQDAESVLNQIMKLKFSNHVTQNSWAGEVEWLSELSEITHQLHKELGWSTQVQELATKSLKAVEMKMQELPKLRDFILKFKDSSTSHRLYKHTSLLSYIAIGLLTEFKAVKNYGENEVQSLAAAAIIHDIALDENLYEKNKEFKEAILKNTPLFGESFVKYQEHPELAAHVAANWKSVNPIVEEIVMQHEEHPSGNGFPFKLKAKDLAPLSCVFILAHELTDFVLDNNNNIDLKKFYDQYKDIYYDGLYRDLMKSVRNAL